MAKNMPSDKGAVQGFEWGTLRWIYEPKQLASRGVSIGFATIYPRRSQLPHQHSDEQFIYIISGQGKHMINDSEILATPGQLIYVPPLAIHQIINDGMEPLEELLICLPTKGSDLSIANPPSINWSEHIVDISNDYDLSALQRLYEQFAALTGLGITLLDTQGQALTNPVGMPDFCKKIFSIKGVSCNYKTCFTGNEKLSSNGMVLFECCPQVVCLAVPIVVLGQRIALLRCGHVFLSLPQQLDTTSIPMSYFSAAEIDELIVLYKRIPVVPKNRLYGVAETLGSITSSLMQSEATTRIQRFIAKQKDDLLKQLEINTYLGQSLREAQLQSLQYQINPHFLYNALNTISSLAILEDAEKTRQAVSALAKIFRYSLQTSKHYLVTLEQELEHLSNYLFIQKLRFTDKIKFIIEVPDDLKSTRVPFMTLQPLVENAIIHGLGPADWPGFLSVKAIKKDEFFELIVEDNGVGMDERMISILNAEGAVKAGNNKGGLGIQNVRNRLKIYSGDRAYLTIESRPGIGTKCVIGFPLQVEG